MGADPAAILIAGERAVRACVGRRDEFVIGRGHSGAVEFEELEEDLGAGPLVAVKEHMLAHDGVGDGGSLLLKGRMKGYPVDFGLYRAEGEVEGIRVVNARAGAAVASDQPGVQELDLLEG